MSEENNSPITPVPGQAMARPAIAPMPLQRSNYGIPPRQSVGQPQNTPVGTPVAPPQPVANTGRMMDFAPRRTAPQPVPTPQPVAAVAPASVPVAEPVVAATPQPVSPVQTVDREPIFATARKEAAAEPTKKSSLLKRVAGKSRIPLLVVGTLLVIGGGVRYVQAGNISGYTVAVGAVTVNDGHKTTIQYVADDGQMHHFSQNRSDRNQIPGTSVEVAYQKGAAEATVKQISVVHSARANGIKLVIGGVLLLAIGGLQTVRALATATT